MEAIKKFFGSVKPYLGLALRLVVGVVIAFAVPGSFWAVVASQILHLAVVGTGGPKLSKPLMSGVVFIVALAISAFQLNGSFPAFPVFGGDAAAFSSALLAWAQAATVAAAPIIGAAMVSYNVAFEKLLQAVSDRSETLAFEPEENVRA